MRRFLLPAGLLLLTACAKTPGLPSAQVMEKTVLAAQELQSAAFSVRVALSQQAPGREMSMEAFLDGRMQDGGREMAMTVDAETSTTDAGQTMLLGINAELVVLGEQETYLKIMSVDGNDPRFMNPMLAGLLNQWWALPATGTGAAATPDPRLLRLQTEVLTVTDDHGIGKMDGRDAYHYDVGIDQQKLVAFFSEIAGQRGVEADTAQWDAMLSSHDVSGEAWIDAETFHVLRLTWKAASRNDAAPMTVEMEASFSGHNAAEPVSPPADAQPFPRDYQQLLQLMPGDAAALPDASIGQELTPEMQEEILRSLLENR